MKLSKELYNAFNAGDSVELDFAEKARALEDEIELLKVEIKLLREMYEEATWSNQR